MKTYLRILRYAKPVGLLAPQYLVYTILEIIFGIINFAMMIPLLNVLFRIENIETYEYPDFSISIDYLKGLFYYYFSSIIEEKGQFSALYLICGLVVASTIIANLFKYLSNIILAMVRINVITNLRTTFFERLMSFDLKYFSSSRRGDVIARGTSDILEIENSVVSSFTVLLKDPLKIISLFTVLFWMNAQLTLYTLILLPVSGLLISQLVKKLRKSATRMQNTLGEIGNVLDETIGGMRVVKAFGAESYLKKKFRNKVDRYAKYNFTIAKIYNLAPPTSETFGAITLGLLLLIGGQMIFNNESSMEAADFIGFIVLFSQILAPAKSLANGFSNINKGIASGERVFHLIDEDTAILSKPDGKDCDTINDGIMFSDVSFAYEEKDVLKNINFKIPKGKVVALVGPSGGGKSTIADLVPRFYDPYQGEILLDGTNLKDFKTESLRKAMGIVTQESILFHDTIYNNISFGNPNATFEEVTEAAKVANAHEFIEKLEKGYETEIGERGAKLSGGQRQRLSIARAVLKNPPIMILDEATSALDSESEKLVQEAIYNLMQNRTTLVIAHRLSTIQNADEILVIKEGEIIQRGSHESLMEDGGLYKKLTDMQSF
ncbi:MAG: ABC transporter ATP-binding protein [Bacteroidota bacterium]